MVTLAFILALPLLNSTVAFSAVISISTVGLYISCEHLICFLSYAHAMSSCYVTSTIVCKLSYTRRWPLLFSRVALRGMHDTVAKLDLTCEHGLILADCDIEAPRFTVVADAIPIAMRLINHKDFEPGPFNLGKFGPIVAIIAVLWVVFLTVSMKALLTRCGTCLWVLPCSSQSVVSSATAHAVHCHNASTQHFPVLGMYLFPNSHGTCASAASCTGDENWPCWCRSSSCYQMSTLSPTRPSTTR